jgi:hypothetical protein
VQALARVLLLRLQALEQAGLVGVHGDPAVVVRDVQPTNGSAVAGKDRIEDLLHVIPPGAAVG